MNITTRILIALPLCFAPACSDAPSLPEGTPDVAISQPTTGEIESADTEGFFELQKALLADTIAVLKTIEDAESAKAALPLLALIGERVAPLLERRRELTAKNPMAYMKHAGALIAQIQPLNTEGKRISTIEGAKEVLKPELDKIFAAFSGK